MTAQRDDSYLVGYRVEIYDERGEFNAIIVKATDVGINPEEFIFYPFLKNISTSF